MTNDYTENDSGYDRGLIRRSIMRAMNDGQNGVPRRPELDTDDD